MLEQDLLIITNWWLVWFFLGAISFPATWWWLGSDHKTGGIWDQGYSFARTFGWIVIGYFVWLGASIQLWSFGKTAIWFTVLAWLALNAYIVKRYKDQLQLVLQLQWKKFLKLEIIFAVALFCWSIIRGYQPDINGLEKFMDFGFMQSVINSNGMPPADMWFAGHGINYYYFGHYLSGMFTLFTGTDPAIAYNLLIATIFALSFQSAVGLGGALYDSLVEDRIGKLQQILPYFSGLLTAFLLTLRGNLHTATYYLNKNMDNPVDWLPPVIDDSGNFKNYWYPDASRYIEYTIHEFPIYSFVVADLHAHMMNLPIVLVFLAAVIKIVKRIKSSRKNHLQLWQSIRSFLSGKEEVNIFNQQIIRWYEILLLGFLLGIYAMTNAWDVPIYGLVLSISLVLLYAWTFKVPNKVYTWIFGSVILVLLWLLALSRMQVWLTPEVDVLFSQILVADDGSQTSVTGVMALLLSDSNVWGMIVLLLFSLIIFAYMQRWKSQWNKQLLQAIQQAFPWAIGAGVLAMIVSLPFQLQFKQIAEGLRFVNSFSNIDQLLILWGWDLFHTISFAIFITVLAAQKDAESKIIVWDWIIAGLYSVAWLLIVMPELIYVKDIYIADYHRANTMFKLVYQSWVIFSITGTYTIIRISTYKFSEYITSVKWGWLIWACLGLFSVGMYTNKAVEGYYDIFRCTPLPIQAGQLPEEKCEISQYQGLNGEQWLAEKYPDEYAAIEWLRELDDQPVIVEAVGDSYTEFDMVSAYTGYPTVQGWLVHEWLWRGGFDEPGNRRDDVFKMYNSTDPDQVRVLLNKYHVQYVFVGANEREKYPDLTEAVFQEIGELVFEQNEVRIYRVK